jgi:hypothetical protein
LKMIDCASSLGGTASHVAPCLQQALIWDESYQLRSPDLTYATERLVLEITPPTTEA